MNGLGGGSGTTPSVVLRFFQKDRCCDSSDKCREEFRVRQQLIEGLKSERSFIVSLVVFGGAFGALAAGLTTQAARWLWDTFLAILSYGWNALAAWWNL